METEIDKIYTGELICWNGNFGSITDNEDHKTYFIHQTDIKNQLTVGQEIKFYLDEYRGRTVAKQA